MFYQFSDIFTGAWFFVCVCLYEYILKGYFKYLIHPHFARCVHCMLIFLTANADRQAVSFTLAY